MEIRTSLFILRDVFSPNTTYTMAESQTSAPYNSVFNLPITTIRPASSKYQTQHFKRDSETRLRTHWPLSDKYNWHQMTQSQ